MGLSNEQKAIVTYLIDALKDDELQEFIEGVRLIDELSSDLIEVQKQLTILRHDFDNHLSDHLMDERDKMYEHETDLDD